MYRFATLVALLAVVAHTAVARDCSRKVLVAMSSADSLPLKLANGSMTTVPTGFYIDELMFPLMTLLDAGWQPTFANPNGNRCSKSCGGEGGKGDRIAPRCAIPRCWNSVTFLVSNWLPPPPPPQACRGYQQQSHFRIRSLEQYTRVAPVSEGLDHSERAGADSAESDATRTRVSVCACGYGACVHVC